MKTLLVTNANAGRRGRSPRAGCVAQRLRQLGIPVREVQAGGPGEAAGVVDRLLRDESPEETRVLAVGGDGTVNALLPALMGTPFPVGILPAGTLNALAGELGIPRALGEAIAIAVGGRRRRLDLGLANGRPFAQMAGVGFDGAVVRWVVPPANKNMLSIPAVARGLRLLATYAPTKIRLTSESARLEANAWLVLVANAGHYTHRLRIVPNAAIDDGRLDVWMLTARSRGLVLDQAARLLRRGSWGCPSLYHLRVQRLRIESDPPAFFHVDGDPGGRTPVDISIVPAALTVMAPAGRQAPGNCS